MDCPVFRSIHIEWSISTLRLIRGHDPIICHHYHQLLPRFSSHSLNHDSRLICAWYLSIMIPLHGHWWTQTFCESISFRALLDLIECLYIVMKRNIWIHFWIYGLWIPPLFFIWIRSVYQMRNMFDKKQVETLEVISISITQQSAHSTGCHVSSTEVEIRGEICLSMQSTEWGNKERFLLTNTAR